MARVRYTYLILNIIIVKANPLEDAKDEGQEDLSEPEGKYLLISYMKAIFKTQNHLLNSISF